MILLCPEDLRFVACSVEDALRARGWQVDVEFGREARPWIQKTPPVRPSVRILCIPGSVDPALARQIRTALRPEPDADLHILGVDDPRGLVQEIERLAGARPPQRRMITQPLAHVTQVEELVRSERSWKVAAITAITACLVTLTGSAALHLRDTAGVTEPEPAPLASAIAVTDAMDAVQSFEPAEPEPSALDDSVMAAVAPTDPGAWIEDEAWLDETPPEEEDEIEDEIIIFDDAPAKASAAPRHSGVTAPPLAEPTAGAMLADAMAEAAPIAEALQLPKGFLPVAGLSVEPGSDPAVRLPVGFLPVAGMSVIPGVDPLPYDLLPNHSYDPFVSLAAFNIPVADYTRMTFDPFAPTASAPAEPDAP